MRYLLDANVCVDAMRRRPEVVERLQACSPNDCAISVITLFELKSGALKSANPAQELAKIDRLGEILFTLNWDPEASDEAAAIRADLESAGQKIGAYDTLIAGRATSTQLTLVTNNTSEFSRVADLDLEDWRS